MKGYFLFFVSVFFLFGCQDSIYRSTESNLLFLEKNKGNEVYLIDETSGVFCKGIVNPTINGTRDVQYFHRQIKVSVNQGDTCQGFYLMDQLDGEGLVLSDDRKISTDDYKSYLNYYIPFDFKLDSFYVLEQLSGDVFGRFETPQLGCYELGVDFCSCDEFYSRDEYKVLKEISSDSILIGNGLFLKTSKINRRKIRRMISKSVI